MFQKHTLKNGLRIVTIPVEQAKTVTVLVMVETGSKYETKETNGLSHFLEHMFFKGTKRRPDTLTLALEIDNIGGEHNAFTSKEFTGYYAKAAAKHEDKLLDIISDMYLHSRLEAQEIEREKGVIVEEVNMIQDMPMAYVSYLFEKLLYGDQPAGWLTIGTKENIRAWHREHFLDYWQTHYLAANTTIFIAGEIDATESLPKAQKFFEAIPTKAAPQKAAVQERQEKSAILLHHKKTDQTHFCVGVRGYNVHHPDYYALQVLSALLGQGMSSRLFIEVRERRGLAYYVKADYEAYTDCGYLVVSAGVPNDKADDALKVILAEGQKLTQTAVPAAELQKTKEQLKGRLLLGLETPDDLAFWLGEQEVVHGRMQTVEEIFQKVDAVSIADLKRVAQDIFQERKLNLALIGPHPTAKKFQDLLTFK